jgi:hypothetical protein
MDIVAGSSANEFPLALARESPGLEIEGPKVTGWRVPTTNFRSGLATVMSRAVARGRITPESGEACSRVKPLVAVLIPAPDGSRSIIAPGAATDG